MNTLAELLLDCTSTHQLGREYHDKMIHPIPDADVVERMPFILRFCRDKSVVNFGCASGTLHEKIKAVASKLIGVDKDDPCDWQLNLDDCPKTLTFKRIADVLVCGEVLEHLSNPGQFLDFARKFGVPMIITVPNAFSAAANSQARKGTENVNRDHVCWYSYHTLKILVERHGFNLDWFGWYRGQKYTAEGMVVVVK